MPVSIDSDVFVPVVFCVTFEATLRLLEQQ
jgi:hypothetical protein